jgi:hypothetical protein
MSKEETFRQRIANLKSCYVDCMVEDLDNDFDLEFMEMNGYQNYQMIAHTYSSVENKENILEEFGFTIDNNNHTLKLDDMYLRTRAK